MKWKLLLALCAFTLASAQNVHAQPPVSTWSLTKVQVWPNPQNSTATFDTLLQQAFGVGIGDTASSTVAGYNKQFSDSVNVLGARSVALVAVSAQVGAVGDSILCVTYGRLAEGKWCATSIASCLGVGQVAAQSTIASSGVFTNEGKILWEWQPELDTSGTPHPINNAYVKWRLRSGDVRGYATASLATKSATGAIQVWAYVWR